MKNTLRKALLMAMIGLTPAAATYANDDRFTVKQIQVEGLERISSSTVYDDLGIKEGQSIDAESTDKAIQSLFKTGYFKNIEMIRDGDTLRVKVVEQPAIGELNFTGNKKIKTEDLKKVLVQAGLDAGNLFDPQTLFFIRQSLLQQYAMMGYYSTRVETKITELPRNRVAINIDIAEGKTAKITGVNVIGNEVYDEKTLLDTLTLKVPSIWNFWGIFDSSGEYSPVRMQSSLEGLSNYYLNSGYLDFRVTSRQASMTPEKENTYVAFDVTEGEQYKVTKVNLEGQFVVPKAELEQLVQIHDGDVFSREKVINSVDAIKNFLGNKGYAFANVNPVPKIDTENKTVELTLYVTPGKKVYVRNINFLGNNVTNDYVYRRQMQYYETGVYNDKMINQSKIKLQRMPFVQDVDMKTQPVPGTDDMVDLNYNITERSANSISANLGWSDLYKFMVGANLSLPNVLGTGNIFSIGAQLSKPYQNLSMSYTDPFFTESGVSQTIGAYVSRTNFESTSIANYQLDQMGATLGYSVPTALFDSVSFGGGIDRTVIKQPSGGTSSIVTEFINSQGGKTEFNTVTANLGWNHDSTNRAFFPTAGSLLGINGQAAVPGSDLQWYKINASAGYFYPIYEQSTISLKAGVGFGDGYGKTQGLPFFQNYYGGGWGGVRGFMQGGMGPNDIYTPTDGSAEQGNAIGGNLNIYTNVDVLFPIPGVKDSSNMRWGMFFDMGNVYNTYSYPQGTLWSEPESYKSPNFSNLKYSVGLEFQWVSPLGPMAFSLAKPLNVKPGDNTQVFQFTLGQTF